MDSLEMEAKGSCKKQAAMLEHLRDCLDMERESLIQVDVDQLWEIMEKKNSLVTGIEQLENEIKLLVNQYFQNGPEKPRAGALRAWPWFRDYSKRTALLKEDIRTRLNENFSFIEDTLGFFDELVAIIARGEPREQGYDYLRKPPETNGPRIYHREV